MTANSTFNEGAGADLDSGAEFGTNVGEEILAMPEARQVIRAERPGSGRRINVGRTEQKIRLVAGTALLAAAATARVAPKWRIAMAAFGAMEIITGTTRHCPLWQSLGVSTVRNEP